MKKTLLALSLCLISFPALYAEEASTSYTLPEDPIWTAASDKTYFKPAGNSLATAFTLVVDLKEDAFLALFNDEFDASVGGTKDNPAEVPGSNFLTFNNVDTLSQTKTQYVESVLDESTWQKTNVETVENGLTLTGNKVSGFTAFFNDAKAEGSTLTGAALTITMQQNGDKMKGLLSIKMVWDNAKETEVFGAVALSGDSLEKIQVNSDLIEKAYLIEEYVDNTAMKDLNKQVAGIFPPPPVDPDEPTEPTPSDPTVPEPTTTTLGLLALAGLAARRRRK